MNLVNLAVRFKGLYSYSISLRRLEQVQSKRMYVVSKARVLKTYVIYVVLFKLSWAHLYESIRIWLQFP
jgi:hypothetical protein